MLSRSLKWGLLSFAFLGCCLPQIQPLEAAKKGKKDKPAKVKIGGRFYRDSKIRLGSTATIADHKASTYRAALDPKGVIHVFTMAKGSHAKKASMVIEPMWVEGKGKDIQEVLLKDLKFSKKSEQHWLLKGSFDEKKGTYSLDVQFEDDHLIIHSDAESKSGDLKLTFSTVNLVNLYKKDKDKADQAANKAKFSVSTTKNKKHDHSYKSGLLKEAAKYKCTEIVMDQHFKGNKITFDCAGSEGYLDIKAYSGGTFLKDGFNVRYHTSAKGKSKPTANKLKISFAVEG